MAQPSVHGRFIWEGLATEDPAAAASFYSKVTGWRSEPFAKDPTFTIYNAASGPVASMRRPTDELRAQGLKARWVSFIGADDIDATVANAEKLGAKVLRAVAETAGVGRTAILADPQGATFGLFQVNEPPAPKSGAAQAGETSWHELAASDSEAALKFYQELFGWTLSDRMDMGPMGSYLIFAYDGAPRGGIYKLSQAGGPHWLAYTEVADADKAAAAAAKAGGRVLNGPLDVPGGRIAQLADPIGAAFAVHTAKIAAVAAPSPPPKPPAAKKAAPKPSAPPAAGAPAEKPAAAAPKPAAPAPKPAAPAPKPAAPVPKPAEAVKPAARALPKPAAPVPARPAAAAAPKKKAAAKKKAAPPKKSAPKKAAGKKKSAKKAARVAARKAEKKVKKHKKDKKKKKKKDKKGRRKK